MVPVLSRSREFSLFLDGTGTGTGKNWSRKKVPVPVSEKIGPGKKYRYRYRKNLVPEKSTGPGTGKKLVPEKVPVPVSEKNLGTVTLCQASIVLGSVGLGESMRRRKSETGSDVGWGHPPPNTCNQNHTELQMHCVSDITGTLAIGQGEFHNLIRLSL